MNEFSAWLGARPWQCNDTSC